MSENIIFVLDFIINSDKFSTDLFFVSLFSWNGMGMEWHNDYKIGICIYILLGLKQMNFGQYW